MSNEEGITMEEQVELVPPVKMESQILKLEDSHRDEDDLSSTDGLQQGQDKGIIKQQRNKSKHKQRYRKQWEDSEEFKGEMIFKIDLFLSLSFWRKK